MILLLYIFDFLILFILITYYVWYFDTIFGEEDFSTSKEATRIICSILEKKQNVTFYDLGSCRGNFALEIAKKLPSVNVVGVDNSMLRILFSIPRSVFKKNISFIKQDLFFTDISQADYVYVYLPRELLPKLAIKLQKELKPGALVITYLVDFPSWKEQEVFLLDPKNPSEKVYIYKPVL